MNLSAWDPSDRRYRNGELLSWGEASWRQRMSLLLFWGVMWGVVFPACAGVMLVVIGMMIEGVATRSEQLDRCQRQAVTPYDYHRCR